MVNKRRKEKTKETNSEQPLLPPGIDETTTGVGNSKQKPRAATTAKNVALGVGAVATTAGLGTMAARARKSPSTRSFTGVSSNTPASSGSLGKGVAIAATGAIGAATAGTLMSRKRAPSVKANPSQKRTSSSMPTQSKNKSKHPDKQKAGYDWVSDRSVKGGGYWRKKRPRRAIAAGIGRAAKKKVTAKAKRKGRSVAKGIGKSIAKTLAASLAATAVGAGLKAMAERARNSMSPATAPPKTTSKFGAVGKKAAIVAAEAAGATAGATVAGALIQRARKKGGKSAGSNFLEEDAPPGTPKSPKPPKSPNSSGGFNTSASDPDEEVPPPGTSGTAKNPKSPKTPEGGTPVTPEEVIADPWEGKGQRSQAPGATDLRAQSFSAGTAVLQRRAARKSAARMLLPQSAKTQESMADPWEGEAEPTQAVSREKGETTPDAPGSMALPSASRRLSKAQLKKAISESRDLKSKRKRTETEIEKANNKIELGKSLQKKESDADKLRGLDYEMIAKEKKANLEARLAEIESKQSQLNEILSPKTPSRSGSTPLSNEGAVTTIPKGMEVMEKRKGGKKNSPEEEVKNETPPQPESPVKTEETVKTKKSKRSIVQRIANAVTRKKEEPLATQEGADKETPKERRRRERAENKRLKQELIEQTGRSASKAMVRNAYKTPLNLVVPGLGDAIEKADKFFGDKSRIEKWAQELEDNGDITVSRRELFRGGRRFVAKQTVAKPKGITQELRRGAEISKDFFDKLVGGGTDELILKGSKNRGFGAERGRRIQLTKQEFERITRDYTNPQRRQLRNFLDFIGFPLP